MTYQESLDFLYQQFPAYQKLGKKAYKADLSNIIALCKALGNPEQNQNYIHIAGTNGKGSTSHMTAALLQAQGLKVGIYSSPHIKDFGERIKINGEYISEDYVIQFTEEVKKNHLNVEPSFFEITFAMALSYFKDQNTDVNIIEVGLGGRLDATNIINPKVCAITNVSLDHVNILGHDVPTIAKEKAGIIKPGVPVVAGIMSSEAFDVVVETAIGKNTPFVKVPNTYKGRLDLFGEHQKENASLAIKIAQLYSDAEIELKALEDVCSITNFRGRGEVIYQDPAVICDGAHNEDGVGKLVNSITNSNFKRVIAVYGCSNDKDVEEILSIIPDNWELHLVEFDHDRSMKLVELEKAAKKIEKKYFGSKAPVELVNSLKSSCNENDLILIFGSFFLLENFY